MKIKALCSFLLTLLLLTSCYKEDSEELGSSNPLHGTWIAEQVDGKEILTNDKFVFFFAENTQHIHAHLYYTNQGAEWAEDVCYFEIKGNTVSISGAYTNGKNISIQSTYALQGDLLHIQVEKYIYDGTEMPAYIHKYVLRKATENLYDKLIGIWKGGSTTPGMIGKYDAYWRYNKGTVGTFDYKYFDEEKQAYVIKEDNDGHFYLYGNLLVTTYNNDLQQGTKGKECESWMITTDGMHMEWVGRRENNTTINFSLDRVTSSDY